MRRAGPLLALVLLGAGSLSGEAQPARDAPPPAKLAGASARAAGRLATADARIEQKQWSDAFAELQALLDESADELVTLHAGRPDHSLAVRHVYPLRLATLPPPALKLYRARFDAQAQRWLDEAVAARDAAQLRRIVDEAFVSRPAERAIDLLGDLALARGDFAEARRWWRMLAAPASEAAKPKPADGLTLSYPDPQIDLALVRAKLILAFILAGDRAAARTELAAFRTAHPKGAGLLAGKDGSYADTLQALLERAEAPPTVELTDWPTFAGTPERNGVASAMPRVRWLEEPWRARLDGQPVQGVLEPLGRIENPAAAARALTVHPVIVGRRVLFADHHSVTALDLRTGRKLGRFDLLDDPKTAHLKGEPARQGERHTLTVAGGRIYARLGSTAMGLARDGKDAAAETVGDSFIVCLGLTPVGDKLPVHWQVAARANDKDLALFEGAPLVDAGRAWVARLRCQRNWMTTEIDCYDAQTGARRWRQEVCESQEGGDEPRHRQQLLTLAGPNVVYCSHSGAVVALDAATGKRAWSVRYPRRGYRIANGFPSPRDLAPCLYADGRLYVAPTDAGALYCLDARTGRTLWQSRPLEVGHLLGVVKNRVIFTTAATPQGIRALDAATGADLRHWLHPSGGHDELPSLGRGVLAGDKVIWPTIHGLRILDQDDGQVSTQDFVPLNGVRPGNIAVGEGCIVIATERELHGYVAPRLFIEQRRKDAAAQPKSAPALFRLALAEADSGHYDAALAAFESVKRGFEKVPADVGGSGLRDIIPRMPRESPDEAWHWRDVIRWNTGEVLLARSLASLQREGYQWLQDAANAADHQFLPLRQRIWLDLARQGRRDGVPGAVQVGRNGLGGRSGVRDALVESDDGPQRGGWIAFRQHIQDLEQWPKLLPTDEAMAETIRAEQRLNPDKPLLQVQAAAIDYFPLAALPREASFKLAKQHQADKDDGAAASVLRRLLRNSARPQQETPVLAELALCYERQHLWEPARGCWQRLAADLGDQRLTVPSVGTARDIATKRLAEPHFQPKRVMPPDLALPLRYRWTHDLDEGPPAIAAIPQGCAIASGKLISTFALAGAFAKDEGKKLWQHRGHLSISWLQPHADTLIACGPRSLQQFQAQDGAVNWTVMLADASDDDFGAFQLVAGRLFCLQGQRRLLAIDVEAGRILWHRNAPGAEVRSPAPNGRFHPDYLATAERVLLQTGRGAVVLLDARTGEAIAATEPNDDARPQAPVRVGAQRACLVRDPRHLVLIDLGSGKEVWRHAFGHPTTLSGEPPQLLCNGDDLLVLVPRNYGYELNCLDIGSGEPTRPQLLRFHTPTAPQLSTGAISGGTLCFAVGDVLQGYDLTTRRRPWQTPLPAPGRRWQVIPTKNALLVVPDQATTAADGQYLWRRWLGLAPSFAVPTSRSTPGGVWTAATAAVSLAQSPSKASIVAIDPRDGKLLQTLDVKGQGGALQTQIVGNRLIVAFAGSVWGLQ